MFDLFRSRAKAVRYLLGGLLLLVALSMVVTLIPGYGTGGGQQDQVVAEIGKDTLTARDVQQQMQMAMRNRSVPTEMAGFFAGQLIDEMISTRALIYQARQMGLEVTDAELARAVRMNLPQLFPNGQFVGKEAYAAVLQQQGFTIPEFEAQLRQQMLMGRLSSMVGDGVIVTPQEVEKEYKRRNDKVKLSYVALSPEKFLGEAKVTPADISAYYAKSAAEFRLPETRSVDILVTDEARLLMKTNVSDADLLKVYEENKDQYRVPERVHVRHVLLKTSGKPKEEAPKLLARAQEVLKELKGGADFAAVATKNSEDPVSAAKGGDLGWIVRGQTVPAFETAAFSLKPNELSGVITTEYGYHIIQVLAKEDAHVRSFEEVKETLARDYKRQLVADTLQKSVEQAHDELAKHPQQAVQIAQKFDLDLKHVDAVTTGSPIPDVTDTPDFSEAIGGLARGGVSQVVTLPGNRLGFAAVTDVKPARQAQLAEVEAQIRQKLTNQAMADLAQRRAAEVARAAQAAGGDLKKAAQPFGLEVKTTQDFGQDGAADGIGPGTSLTPAFQQAVGSVFGPVVLAEKRFVCRIESRIEADVAQLDSATRAQIRNDIKQDKGRQRVDLFMDSIRTAMVRSGKIKIHKEVMNRIIGAYRS
ncbi:MAG TPA: peptidyl-prolyl cis-trans isomerase [Bryobacteraceae bacterium]|nr:peptidyl-prolyl cis-trans isomerase [Bryobacteraceae bacterium]